MKKILIVGAQHGNEPLGEALYAHIVQNRPDLAQNIAYVTGNPRAKKANVRYIESDLNRSYTGGNTTYEERRAKRLLASITKQNFDLVIDAHTTTCAEPPCFIAHALDGEAGKFMAACNITKVVHMHPEIAKSSLIGVCSQAVSVEVTIDEVKKPLLHELTLAIDNYVRGRSPFLQKTMYEIDGFILKNELTEQEANELQNFKKSSYGYYPILTGENSYKKLTNYLGFKAYKVYKTKV